MEVSICFHWIGLSEALQETLVGLQHIVITTPEKKHRQKTYIDTQKTKKKKQQFPYLCRHLFFGSHRFEFTSGLARFPRASWAPVWWNIATRRWNRGGKTYRWNRGGNGYRETNKYYVQQLWGKNRKRLVDSLVMSRFHMLEFFIWPILAGESLFFVVKIGKCIVILDACARMKMENAHL